MSGLADMTKTYERAEASIREDALSRARQNIVDELGRRFEIDGDRVLFLDPEKPAKPWLPAEVLASIARQTGRFREIEEGFDQYIPAPLNQVVHYARVIDEEGRAWRRSGVATVGETPGHHYRGSNPDAHQLAASRALGAALDGAGFNPLKAGFVARPGTFRRVEDGPNSFVVDGREVDKVLTPDRAAEPAGKAAAQSIVEADETETKNKHLKQIHAMASKVGLIVKRKGVPVDYSGYRSWMLENFGVKSAAGLDATQRLSAIEALRVLIQKEEAVDL
jgi:hypothetical protein